MKQMLSRWLLPFVLSFGVLGSAAADSGLPIALASPFVGQQGSSFQDFATFEIDVAKLLQLDVVSLGLSNLSLAISNTGSKVVVQGPFSFGSSLSSPFSLDAGSYLLTFAGKVVAPAAGYVVTLTAVPEPAEWMMILAGVAMMGFVVSRRRNNV